MAEEVNGSVHPAQGEISEGWVTIIQPSSDSMLSKKEETSLAVDGGISASTIGGRRGL
jgi:hypothetical protein